MNTSSGVIITLSSNATKIPKNSRATTTTPLQRSTSVRVGHVTRFISDFTSRKNWKRFFFGLSSFLEDFAVSLEDADLSSEPFLNRPPFFSSVASATGVGLCSSSSRLALRC